MDGFTPASAAAGGALIGLSAALLWIGLGRIAGISGILGGLLRPRGGDVARCVPGRVAGRAGPVRAFRRRGAGRNLPGRAGNPGRGGTPGRIRGAACQRLHERPWGVRAGAAVAAVHGGDRSVHGHGRADRLSGPPCDGRVMAMPHPDCFRVGPAVRGGVGLGRLLPRPGAGGARRGTAGGMAVRRRDAGGNGAVRGHDPDPPASAGGGRNEGGDVILHNQWYARRDGTQAFRPSASNPHVSGG